MVVAKTDHPLATTTQFESTSTLLANAMEG
jgi:hypothetical protein